MGNEQPVKIITIGGAKFDANQVASQSTTKKNGKTYYVVSFKSGATVQYPQQAQKNNAAIDIGIGESGSYVGNYSDSPTMAYRYDHMGEGRYKDLEGGEGAIYQKADKYTISRFWGLEFSGTQKPDDVNLNGCTRCTVNINGGNSMSGDKVTLSNSSNFKSRDNEVVMDKNDEVRHLRDDGIIDGDSDVRGAGTYHEGDSRDKLK